MKIEGEEKVFLRRKGMKIFLLNQKVGIEAKNGKKLKM